MKRLVAFAVLMIVLLAGGGLTALLVSSGGGSVLPVLQTVGSPDGSPMVVLPWKAEQFFLLVGFIIFNLVGIAATLAVIFWFLDRGVRQARKQAEAAAAEITAAE